MLPYVIERRRSDNNITYLSVSSNMQDILIIQKDI